MRTPIQGCMISAASLVEMITSFSASWPDVMLNCRQCYTTLFLVHHGIVWVKIAA